MTKHLRVLIVEDSEDDAYLLLRELRRGGYEVAFERVDTPEAMSRSLDQRGWDLITSDYSMPQFNGLAALALLQGKGLDVPFIIVSATIGEEVAVEAMRAGAQDYLMKGSLGRLLPAVERELREAAERRARKQAEEALLRSEEQLRQVQKLEAIGRLAGGIAHDFNNHLGIILGYSDMVGEKLGADHPLCNKVGVIRNTAQRAAALTKQLLAFSRKQVFEPRIVDLNATVSELKIMLQPLIGEDIEVVTALDPTLGKVRVDPSQIDQVLMNLAVNARDAMPQGGRLVVETKNVELDEAYARSHISVLPGRYVMLAVSDNGMGISKETQSHIFEPFFTTKEKGKGTGLGLSTVYGIVKQSGGNIWVYSELSRGTTFKIYFPLLDGNGQVVAEKEGSSPIQKGEEVILVAEDETVLRELTSEFLRSAGYTVLEAANGNEAVDAATQHAGPIHLLITDAVMPGMSGRELALVLQSRRPGLKVLYISGYTDDAVLRNGMLRTDMEFLQKPFTKNQLLQKARKALGVVGQKIGD